MAHLEDILELAHRILNRINTWACEHITASLVINIWLRILVIKMYHWFLLSLLHLLSVKKNICPAIVISLWLVLFTFSQPELKLIRVACQTQSKASEIPRCQLTGQFPRQPLWSVSSLWRETWENLVLTSLWKEPAWGETICEWGSLVPACCLFYCCKERLYSHLFSLALKWGFELNYSWMGN